jgi:regulator of nucleoside diphosphate kinase
MQQSTTHLGERTLVERDFDRITKLLDGKLPQQMTELLDAADILRSREIPADIVTMYSQVELVDIPSQRRSQITLCFPAESEPAAGLVSVLSPVGCALLGLRKGSIARWRLPGGEERSAEVAAVLFQPEASGDYLR